jgi:hypothetical protein
MKVSLLIFGTIILFLTTISCKKSVENNGLIGNWKLVEQYNGYVNGGNFQWNSVPSANSHILSFTASGDYQRTETINGTQFNCAGTYLLQADNTLEINSSCNTVTEKAFVSELTSKVLIIDRSVIEGVIRYKYSASK